MGWAHGDDRHEPDRDRRSRGAKPFRARHGDRRHVDGQDPPPPRREPAARTRLGDRRGRHAGVGRCLGDCDQPVRRGEGVRPRPRPRAARGGPHRHSARTRRDGDTRHRHALQQGRPLRLLRPFCLRQRRSGLLARSSTTFAGRRHSLEHPEWRYRETACGARAPRTPTPSRSRMRSGMLHARCCRCRREERFLRGAEPGPPAPPGPDSLRPRRARGRAGGDAQAREAGAHLHRREHREDPGLRAARRRPRKRGRDDARLRSHAAGGSVSERAGMPRGGRRSACRRRDRARRRLLDRHGEGLRPARYARRAARALLRRERRAGPGVTGRRDPDDSRYRLRGDAGGCRQRPCEAAEGRHREHPPRPRGGGVRPRG